MNGHIRILFVILILGIVALSAGTSLRSGDIPREINYQGLLTDKDTGTPLAGPVDLTFRLFSTEDCDTGTPQDALWSESYSGVTLDNGIFNVRLGSQTEFPDTLHFDEGYCLGIEVGDEEILPRQQIVPVAYALNALDAFRADTAQIALEVPSHDHDDRYYTESELNMAGTINDPGNPVDWTMLKNVPADFADGIDNIAAGGITEILPGAGLEEEIIGDTKILSVSAGGIQETMLADSAVTGEKIRSNSITSAQIAPGAVTAGEIAPNTITASQIAPTTITAAQISPSTITANEIFANTLTASQLASASVRNDELADSSVTGDKIFDGTITLDDLGQNGASDGQVMKWNGTSMVWQIADDDAGGGGDITSVTAGAGLTGGGETLDVTLDVLFGGGGAVDSVARSDHDHDLEYVNEGQAGSIVTAMIADGNVLSADILDGTITLADLGQNGASDREVPRWDEGTSSWIVAPVDSATIEDESIVSADILDGTITLDDLGQNGASDGEVIKWSDATMSWIVASDSVGSGSGGGGGWVDDGGTVRLEDSLDMVGIGTLTPAAKLDVDGDLRVSGTAVVGSGHTIIPGTGVNLTGANHTADGDHLVIGGGYQNQATAGYATVSGGRENRADGDYAAVGGGRLNRAEGRYSVVSGGGGDLGGDENRAGGDYCTVGGGGRNTAGDPGMPPEDYQYATVGGGRDNRALRRYSTIGGGRDNIADREYATVGGGMNNAARANSTVGGGMSNMATGDHSTVPGGRENEATGEGSFAAGTQARARHEGSFVLAANYAMTGDDTISTGGSEQIVIRADGGIYITDTSGQAPYDPTRPINTSTGAWLSAAGQWRDASDRSLKENFEPVDGGELLERIAELPVTRWNYKIEGESVKHVGPVAQDFRAILGIGNDDRTIAALDEAGVSLAAIQELYRKAMDQEGEIEALRSEIEELRALVRALLDRE